MPAVSDGLQTDGGAETHAFDSGGVSDAAFASFIADQAEHGERAERPTAEDVRASRMLDFDASGDEIIHEILADPGSGTEIAAGLSTPARFGKLEDVDVGALSSGDRERYIAEVQAQQAQRPEHALDTQGIARDNELTRLRVEASDRRALDVLRDRDPVGPPLALAWNALSPEAKKAAVDDWLVDEAEIGEYTLWGDRYLAAQQEIQAGQNDLRQTQANEVETKVLINDWVRHQGLTKAEAVARIEKASHNAAAAGIDLDQLFAQNPEAGLAQLVASDAVSRDARVSIATRRMHQALLDESGTHVGDGYEKLTNDGWKRVNETHLDKLVGPPTVDLSRAKRRAAPRRTAEDLRASISSSRDLQAEIRHVYEVGTNAAGRARAEEQRRREENPWR